jgi:hypothetical protein
VDFAVGESAERVIGAVGQSLRKRLSIAGERHEVERDFGGRFAFVGRVDPSRHECVGWQGDLFAFVPAVGEWGWVDFDLVGGKQTCSEVFWVCMHRFRFDEFERRNF